MSEHIRRTKTEAFFTWIWRLNGLLLLLTISTGLLGFYFLVSDAGSPAWEKQEQAVKEVAGADLVAADLKLQGFYAVHGTNYIVSDLVSPKESSGYGSSGNSQHIRNVLFLEAKSKAAYWAFEGNDQYIEKNWSITNRPTDRYGRDAPEDTYVVAMLWTVSDQPIDNADDQRRQMILVSADGKTKKPISGPIDELVGQHFVDATSYLIFYAREGALHVLDLDPNTLTVRSDAVLEVTT